MATVKRASKKEIFGWAMFDFANSSYTTVIVTVVFSVIFPRLIVGDAPEYRTGNLLWSLSLSISYFLVLLSAPVFGAIMDYTAAKKRFLFAATILTVLTTSSLYFVIQLKSRTMSLRAGGVTLREWPVAGIRSWGAPHPSNL